jgi:beta-glucanase (GH16 family)
MQLLSILKTSALAAAILMAGKCSNERGTENKGFVEDFAADTLVNFRYGSGGNRAEFTRAYGIPSVLEPETRVLTLTMDPDDRATPWQGPNISSHGFCHYGSYSGRIKIPDVRTLQPNVGGVVGFFTYFNDPAINGHSEIDIEWLIADPEIIYMNAWLDTDAPPEISRRRVGRTINLAKGIIYNTTYTEEVGDKTVRTPLSGDENLPVKIQAIENFDASAGFYTYGFDWYPDRIRWWIIHPETGGKVVLWDYRGPWERIPQTPARFMINFWHTDNWPVHTNPNSVERPVHRFGAEFDWVSYTPMGLRTK